MKKTINDKQTSYYQVEGVSYFKWTKKIGDTHLVRLGIGEGMDTLCDCMTVGLGNNYTLIRKANICKECLEIANRKTMTTDSASSFMKR